jgi:eukaryotic-like serine/threonine-protein kinase
MREGAVLTDRYEIGPEIGRGSTATVHRARDRETGQDVAVKLFTAAASPVDSGRDRREADILAGLRHPGLVAFLDSGTTDDHLFVVLELVDGQSLAQSLLDGPLDAADVTALGAALAGALAYVHGRGVVHRDVKPANILLDADGHPRLADFGIARLDGATRVTGTGLVVGTAAYMAPEQVRGGDVGPPADVYSLGLVLLEALTGEREYPGSPVEAAVARLHRPPRVPPALPPALATALRRMTATDPAVRPSAAEVVGLLAHAPAVGVGPAGPAAGALRRLVPLAAAAVLAAGVVGGLALSSAPADGGTAPVSAELAAPEGAPQVVLQQAAPSQAAPQTVTEPQPVAAQVEARQDGAGPAPAAAVEPAAVPAAERVERVSAPAPSEPSSRDRSGSARSADGSAGSADPAGSAPAADREDEEAGDQPKAKAKNKEKDEKADEDDEDEGDEGDGKGSGGGDDEDGDD